ncbi:MAG: hypothetical protein CES88_16090 [Halobacteriovorax sp. JY17]|nr:MAG: hypothetical protein CES88_16090 [Halobacteriovorax sp. JY17]
MILTLSSASALETIDCHDEVKLENVSLSAASLSSSVHHSHQEESDCEDSSDHCIHHCSGIHNIFQFSTNVALGNGLVDSLNKVWFYTHHYCEPFLDSVVKPPLFS